MSGIEPNGWYRCPNETHSAGSDWPTFTTVPLVKWNSHVSDEVEVMSVGATGGLRLNYLATWNGRQWFETDSDNLLRNVVAWRYVTKPPEWLGPELVEPVSCEYCFKAKQMHGVSTEMITTHEHNRPMVRYQVQCDNCQAHGPLRTEEAEAVTDWNTQHEGCPF